MIQHVREPVARVMQSLGARPCILVDSREQTPLRFSSAVDVQRATLPVGDYTIAGYSDQIIIERKAPGDLWQCCGRERARFETELARMRAWPLRFVVIEASIDQILMSAPLGRVKPPTVIHSTIGWECDYAVPFIWAGHARNAAAWVERVLCRLPRKQKARAAA